MTEHRPMKRRHFPMPDQILVLCVTKTFEHSENLRRHGEIDHKMGVFDLFDLFGSRNRKSVLSEYLTVPFPL